MKRYDRINLTFMGLLFLVLLFTSGLYASETYNSNVTYEISLSKDSITPGEPVALYFTFTNTSNGRVTISLVDSYPIFGNIEDRLENEDLKISLLDNKENEIPRRELLCRPKSQYMIFSESLLKPGETIRGEFPLHLRFTTLLEPGKYNVLVKRFTFFYGFVSQDYIESIGNEPMFITLSPEKVSGPMLPLEVEPYDEAKLLAVYDALMTEAQYALANPSGSGSGLDYFDIEAPIRTLLWAYGPAAVPYQIELIYDPDRGFRFWPPAIVHTWDNIVRFATREQVEQVLAFARHPEFEKPANTTHSSRYTPGLVWAIHQWHTHGPEEIKALTKELAEKFPEDRLYPHQMERAPGPYAK